MSEMTTLCLLFSLYIFYIIYIYFFYKIQKNIQNTNIERKKPSKINRYRDDVFKKNRHETSFYGNFRHKARGYWDEVKKYVRNVGYLGYIQVWRDESQQENAFIFDTGVLISEISYRVFGFSLAGTLIYIVLRFASLQLQLMHTTMLYTLLIFVGQTSSRLLSAIM